MQNDSIVATCAVRTSFAPGPRGTGHLSHSIGYFPSDRPKASDSRGRRSILGRRPRFFVTRARISDAAAVATAFRWDPTGK